MYLGDASAHPRRLNLQYTNMNTRGNLGRSLYNALVFGLDARSLGNTGLSGPRAIRWATPRTTSARRSRRDSNNAATNLGLLDPFDPDVDYGWAEFDVRHRFTLGAIWQIPFGRDRGGLFESLSGGWQLSGIFSARSGSPFTVFDCTHSFPASSGVRGCSKWHRYPRERAIRRRQMNPTPSSIMDMSNQLSGAGS